MTNIYHFPRAKRRMVPPAPTPAPATPVPAAATARGGVWAALMRGVWVVTVLVWPLLKWVVSLEVLYQLVRMMIYWDTPGMHAGWTFLGHFAVLTALTYYVGVYKPRGI